MSQHVQELIDKIKTEGVQAAEGKAKEIEDRAKAAAEKIVADAKAQAEQIVKEAGVEAERTRTSTENALKQSARDTLLALKKEIEGTLQKVVAREVKGSLSADELAGILGEVIKASVKAGLVEEKIDVTLSAGDLKKLKDGFIAKLQNEIKQPLTFKSNDGFATGFTISFDEGKSCFDFTDASLVAYLGSYLNTQVAGLL